MRAIWFDVQVVVEQLNCFGKPPGSTRIRYAGFPPFEERDGFTNFCAVNAPGGHCSAMTRFEVAGRLGLR